VQPRQPSIASGRAGADTRGLHAGRVSRRRSVVAGACLLPCLLAACLDPRSRHAHTHTYAHTHTHTNTHTHVSRTPAMLTTWRPGGHGQVMERTLRTTMRRAHCWSQGAGKTAWASAFVILARRWSLGIGSRAHKRTRTCMHACVCRNACAGCGRGRACACAVRLWTCNVWTCNTCTCMHAHVQGGRGSVLQEPLCLHV
jgi:hypothetical protein